MSSTMHLLSLAFLAAHGLASGPFPAMHFACNTTGPENATQLQQLSRYSTVIFEFRQQCCADMKHSAWTQAESTLEAQAVALRAATGQKAWVYRSMQLGSMFALQRPFMRDPANDGLFLRQSSVDPKYNISWRPLNMSIPSATQWFLDTIVAEAAAEEAVGGVFFDEVDASSLGTHASVHLFNDTMLALGRACRMLAAADKRCMLSTVNAFATAGRLANASSEFPLPLPEEAMIELVGSGTPWTRYYQHWMNGFVSHRRVGHDVGHVSPELVTRVGHDSGHVSLDDPHDGLRMEGTGYRVQGPRAENRLDAEASRCAAMVTNAMEEGSRGIPIAARAPAAGSVYAVDLKAALAAFLIAVGKADDGSSFGYGSCWFDECWEWQALFDEVAEIGAPLGPARVSAEGMRFDRSWEHLDIHLDCRDRSASFDRRRPVKATALEGAPSTAVKTADTISTTDARTMAVATTTGTTAVAAGAATDIGAIPPGQLSVGRTNGVAVGVRDVLLFAGGYTDSKGKAKSSAVDIYNVTNRTWSLTHLSSGRTLFAGTGFGDLAFFGCGETDGVHTETDAVDVWNASSSRWLPRTFAKLSQPRKKCSATSIVLSTAPSGEILHGAVVFAGGWPRGGHVQSGVVDIFEYNEGQWTSSTSALSLPRMYMSAASVGPYAIFAGGLGKAGDSLQVDMLHVEKTSGVRTWSTTRLAHAFREATAVATSSKAIFYGAGLSQLLDPATLSWSIRNHSAQWAKMASAVVSGGRYAIFAGGIGCPGNVCSTIEVYDDQLGRWLMAKHNLSVAREYAMGAGVGDVAAIGGGMNSNRTSVAVVDFLTPSDFLEERGCLRPSDVEGGHDAGAARTLHVTGEEPAGVDSPPAAGGYSTPPTARATPPMGFNDWNEIARHYQPWHGGVNQTTVLAIGRALAESGLAAKGYKYINLDCGYSAGKLNSGAPLAVNMTRFPSIGTLSAELRQLGPFQLGIYSSGTHCCDGNVRLGREVADAVQFAEWGVRFVKYDDCNTPDLSAFRAMRKALDRAMSEAIYYSIHSRWTHNSSLTPTPAQSATFANAWRTTNDISDAWASVVDRARTNDVFAPLARPGAFNDPDMLEVGNSLTDTEGRSHFSMWSIMKAPLLIGTDVTRASAATLATLGNAHAISVNQDPLGIQARLVHQAHDKWLLWTGPLQGKCYVGLLVNLQDESSATALRVNVSWAAFHGLDAKHPMDVADLWADGKMIAHQAVGMMVFVAPPGHGCAFYKLCPSPPAVIPHTPATVASLPTGSP